MKLYLWRSCVLSCFCLAHQLTSEHQDQNLGPLRGLQWWYGRLIIQLPMWFAQAVNWLELKTLMPRQTDWCNDWTCILSELLDSFSIVSGVSFAFWRVKSTRTKRDFFITVTGPISTIIIKFFCLSNPWKSSLTVALSSCWWARNESGKN